MSRITAFFAARKSLWVCLWLLSILSLVDIPGSPVFNLPTALGLVYIAFTSAFKATLLLLALTPLLSRRRLRPVAVGFVALFGLLAVINAFCYYCYDMGISRKLILVAAQTTADEVGGFLPGLLCNIGAMFGSGMFCVTAAAVVLLFVLVRRAGSRVFACVCGAASLIGLCCFTAFGLTYSSGRSAHLLSARVVKYGLEVCRWNDRYQEILAHKKPLPHLDSVGSNHAANTVIVVIGESALRSHHSLYGYPLATTPCLDAAADSLFVFSRALASSKTTSGNMERILSFKEDDLIDGDGLDYPLLTDLFNSVGYKTFWLSNQERTGSVSNTSGVMVMNSNVIRYVGADNSEDALCVRYDEALLPEIDKALADTATNKLIFVHLLGSHVEFNQRYPARFNHFTRRDELAAFPFPWLDKDKAQRRAEYDNSIRYTDSLIDSIIHKTAAQGVPALAIYFSDHGENVYDNGPFNGRDDTCAEIPFIIFANNSYAKDNAPMLSRMTQALDRPFSSANFVHMLISLTGSRYRLYEPRLDVLSDSFEIRPRYVDEKIFPGDLQRL